jgi:uncharacterized membrane protein
VLIEIETDLSLIDLTEAEKTILSAAVIVSNRSGIFEISTLQNHSIISEMPRSTLFRAIRTLGEKGRIERLTDEKHSLYCVKI